MTSVELSNAIEKVLAEVVRLGTERTTVIFSHQCGQAATEYGRHRHTNLETNYLQDNWRNWFINSLIRSYI